METITDEAMPERLARPDPRTLVPPAAPQHRQGLGAGKIFTRGVYPVRGLPGSCLPG